MKRTRQLLQVLLVLYLTALTITTLWPSPVDGGGFSKLVVSEILRFCQRTPGLQFVQYSELEAFGNVLLYIPLGIFVVVLFSKLNFWVALLIPILVSLSSEGLQSIFLPARYATLEDVFHNALGGCLGVLISASIRRWLKLRSLER